MDTLPSTGSNHHPAAVSGLSHAFSDLAAYNYPNPDSTFVSATPSTGHQALLFAALLPSVSELWLLLPYLAAVSSVVLASSVACCLCLHVLALWPVHPHLELDILFDCIKRYTLVPALAACTTFFLVPLCLTTCWARS